VLEKFINTSDLSRHTNLLPHNRPRFAEKLRRIEYLLDVLLESRAFGS
jgi:hypothetical protein